MINIQPISERQDNLNGDFLQVNSIFHTIQGEGPLSGHPAIFIRLKGCNLQCPLCDTEYSKGEIMSVEGIFHKVETLHPGPRLVVITGGEPFRQNIAPLCNALLDADYFVQVETNGTLPVSLGLPEAVMIVVAPKTGKVHPSIADTAIAFKYVVKAGDIDPEDGLPLHVLDHSVSKKVARPPERFMNSEDFPGWNLGAIYVQPCDEQDEIKNKENLQAALRSCMKHGYTMQLQQHKILGLE